MFPTQCEKCIYKSENGDIIMGIYVDDGIIIGKNKQDLKVLLGKLKEEFEIKINYTPKSFLGMEINKTENEIIVKQESYANKVLKKFNMLEANATKTPIVSNDDSMEIQEKQREKINFPYREAVGSLLYLSSKTRPDISYAVSFESRSLNEPKTQDIANVKRTMRYLKGDPSNGLIYRSDSCAKKLEAYSDADYAGDLKTRRSTTGFIIFYCGAPIAWCSRRQPIVALSSTEAEFIAAADCVKELLYLRTLLMELTGDNIDCIVKIDNLSAINLIKNGVVNKRSKHIDVRYYFIHEKFTEGLIKIEHCETNVQLADIFTKPLSKEKFENLKNKIMN